ncbi:histamine receptor H2a [Hippocampus zosterae]|uniref:histamine receptor H2a n=1 Tax=Hippocampus zosterae TaxID=109293 RepID=UPI00223D4B25|nr:histamine receptor H2a [Hippocampus zosterae]XP_051926465.1 histamine receptor H2a [Hippocampus zosterae]
MLSKIAVGLILTLLILLTISGNMLVCLAVCASRRLRCLTNCFIVSLAVTDLLLGLAVLPFSAHLQLTDDWPLGPVFCNFYISMDVMLCTASILTLMAISMDRYLAVTMPLRYSSLVLPWRVFVAMASVWTVSVAVSFLPIYMGWNTVNGTVQNHGLRAPERTCRFELNRPYVLTDSLLTFYLPLLVMCWTYLRIFRIARAQIKRIISTRPTWVTTYSCRSHQSAVTTVVSGVPASALREHKATVTLAAVIGAFVVCWLPYFILFTALGLQENANPNKVPEFSIVLWLGYTNSALNPILYGALNRDFRSAYTQLLRCRWPTYSGCQHSPATVTIAGRQQLMEVTLLCGHTPSSCRAGQTSHNFMLQESHSRTNTTMTQTANGTTDTDVNDS